MLRTAYQGMFREKAVPQAERMNYLTWLRYCLDFCEKYRHRPRDPDSLKPFLRKLALKGRSVNRPVQAAASTGLYYALMKNWPDTPEAEDCDGNVVTYVPQVVVDEVEYVDWGEWPESADGGGRSIERIDSKAPADDLANWSASRQPGATPGSRNTVAPVLVPLLSPAGLLLLVAGLAISAAAAMRLRETP